jgi:hypothetical protein
LNTLPLRGSNGVPLGARADEAAEQLLSAQDAPGKGALRACDDWWQGLNRKKRYRSGRRSILDARPSLLLHLYSGPETSKWFDSP